MYTQDRDDFTEVADIMLFRYNLIDAKLWALINKTSQYRKLDTDSIIVSADVLRNILVTNFRSEINKIQAVETTMIYKEATSTYFIWKMLEGMKNLRWIKIEFIRNAGYSRIVNADEMKTIKFSIKIIRGTYRTFDHFNKNELPLVNAILKKSNVLKDKSHYGVVKLGDMLSSLDIFLSEHNSSDIANSIMGIIEVLEQFEHDNPEVLIITDYDSDI